VRMIVLLTELLDVSMAREAPGVVRARRDTAQSGATSASKTGDAGSSSPAEAGARSDAPRAAPGGAFRRARSCTEAPPAVKDEDPTAGGACEGGEEPTTPIASGSVRAAPVIPGA